MKHFRIPEETLRITATPGSSHDMCISQRATVDARICEFLDETRHEVPERSVA